MKPSLLFAVIILSAVTLPESLAAPQAAKNRAVPRPATRTLNANPTAPATTASQAILASRLPNPVAEGSHWWVGLSGMSGTIPGKTFGGTVTAGYQSEYLGADVQVSMASTTFGTIFSIPSYTDLSYADFESAFNPGSELNVPRSAKDPWSFITYQPGISVQGKAFPSFLPMISQKARIGFGPGRMTDNKNNRSFSAWIFTAQADLQLQLKARSHWSLNVGGSMNWGRAIASTGLWSDNLRRIPIVYVMLNAGIVYWF